MEEVMTWLTPDASWSSVGLFGSGNTFLKVHGTLIQKEKKLKKQNWICINSIRSFSKIS